MPIIEADLSYRLTETVGPGDTNAQPTATQSWGGFASTTEVDLSAGNILNNIFRDVSETERGTGITLYAAAFVANESLTDTWPTPVGWLKSEIAGGGFIAIGLDPIGVVATDDDYPQGDTIANDEEAPAGVSFSSPTTKTTGIAVGASVPPGSGFMYWLRLTVPAGASAISFDGCTPRWEQG